MSALSTSVQHYARDCSQFSKGTNRIKGTKMRKEDVTLSLFTGDLMVYMKMLKNLENNY